MPPDDNDELRPGDAVTATQFARELGFNRSVVNTWVTRGYLDEDGERVYVKARGRIWQQGRWVPVYLWKDLTAAEKATRGRARLRRNIYLASYQVRDRPHLDHRDHAAA